MRARLEIAVLRFLAGWSFLGSVLWALVPPTDETRAVSAMGLSLAALALSRTVDR